MELVVQREPSLKNCTLGKLTVNGEPECETLEDVIREQAGVPVAKWKIQDQTAISAGRYRLIITYSPHFHRDMPLLVGVPGFMDVRVHNGNTAKDTDGCVLVGRKRNGESVYESILAFEALFGKIEDAIESGEEVWITLTNPEKESA
jgi:hypothetical protein